MSGVSVNSNGKGSPTPKRSTPRRPRLLDKFAAPPKPQHESKLLSIPPELRLKILRNLLKAEDVIPSKIQVDQEAQIAVTIRPGESVNSLNQRGEQYRREKLQFSSQILACCQELYHEARHVLYKENIASIVFDALTGLHVLSCAIYPTSEQMALKKCNKSINLTTLRGGVFDNTTERCSIGSIYHIYPALAEFGEYKIVLGASSVKSTFMMTRLLRPLVSDKVVTVSLNWVGDVVGDVSRIEFSRLQSCRVWKCKDFSIDSCSGEEADKLKAFITGSEQVKDHYGILTLISDIQKALMIQRDEDTPEMTDAYDRVIRAICSYTSPVSKHVVAFVDAVVRVLRYLKEDGRKEPKFRNKTITSQLRELDTMVAQIA